MNKQERQSIIMSLINEKQEINITEITDVLNNDLGEIINDFKELETEGKIEKINDGIYKLKTDLSDYFSIPFDKRPEKSYNPDFLKFYSPNISTFLGDKYQHIKNQYVDFNIKIEYDYNKNKKIIENIITDLSFSSSKLEGNTYTFLETENLIKYNTYGELKKPTETKMILNHKNTIKYIIENKDTITLNHDNFKKIHTLLCEDLLSNEYLGEIRSYETHIAESAYYPLNNIYQLGAEYETFINKLNKIENPFEQSLFILIFIPYLNVFTELNNRTARICATIPLIKKGYLPLTFLQIKDSDYTKSMLSIYELNDVIPIRNLFINNYLINTKKYM
ncbi:MAG: Fic family protein [Candidatus Gracilibacteria bacterium]|nr:Fic family protein [Candidatus Gracilibacteria bacterium]